MPDQQLEKTYALILAGGSGTRFWPVSRNHIPKQLLNLFGKKTLLANTVDRVSSLIPKERILILTNALQAPEIAKLLPDFPAANIISEPEKRDTAPAIALGIGLVAARDPEATMVVLPSDQLIQDTAAYDQIMRASLATAGASDLLLTIGIRPTWPCPSYGYVERGDAITPFPGCGETRTHKVLRFTEKPDPQTAKGFLEAGTFSWNAGIFIWSIASVCKELETYCPELASFITKCIASRNPQETISSDFSNLPKLSIDYALMERSSRIAMMEATFDWDDVGSWPSVAKYLDADPSDNRANCDLTQIESAGNIVFSREGKKIALLGVDNLIVVETADAILVASKEKADEIKKVVEDLPERLR